MTRHLQRPKSLTDLACDRIRQLIISGELAMGEQLSEASLADELGISKTPVREALLRLKAEGLIDIQPQRGTFVFSLTANQVREICTFREMLEVSALGLAMRQQSARLAAGLEANIAAMARAQAARQWASIPPLDEAFHQVIFDQCDNAYLKEAYTVIALKISALRARLPEESERVSHCQENHDVIVGLVRAGDVPAAQDALALHIRDTLESYLAANGSQLPGVRGSALPRRRAGRERQAA